MIKMSMKFIFKLLIIGSIIFLSCKDQKNDEANLNIRQLIDTIGFTQYDWQFDSIISRIHSDDKKPLNKIYKAAICPHDDYAYSAGLYNKTLEGIKANTIILIGVAHKASKYKLENRLIFGSFDKWKCNDDDIAISPIRDKLLKNLSKEIFIVHDSMMQLEHSLEAINPFLQKNNNKVEIIPILVPYMTFENMRLFSEELSNAVHSVMKKENLEYGKDLAVVISNDAVHYGNTDWGGADLAPFGVDSIGNTRAKQKDLKIIDQCLVGDLSENKIKNFNVFTVKDENYKEYKWVWCGRYSLPFGLLFANKLNVLIENKPLSGNLVGYRSSYPANHIEVTDLGMGHTALANNSHWVAYIGIGYR
jgi:AmmeMemoRadiSam system protein B